MTSKKIIVFYVDDEEFNFLPLKWTLDSLDFLCDLKCFSGGVSFFEECENKGYPDLVLLDVMMPEISGYAIAMKLRQHSKSLPILMITAGSADQLPKECLADPFTHCVLKPLEKSKEALNHFVSSLKCNHIA